MFSLKNNKTAIVKCIRCGHSYEKFILYDEHNRSNGNNWHKTVDLGTYLVPTTNIAWRLHG